MKPAAATEPGPDPDVEEAKPPPKPSGPIKKFSVGVQAWARGQGRINPDFDASDGRHDGAALQRLRLQAGGTYGPLSAFVQVQDARTWGSEQSTASNDANTDLHQGYFELGGKAKKRRVAGFLRAGRQEVIYGKMRLIGHLPWAPTARSFDAIRGRVELGRFGLDAFAAILERGQDFTIEETGERVRNDGSQLYAGQFFAHLHKAANVEALFLALKQRPSASNPAQDRSIVNPDVHVWGKHGGFSYDAEGGAQFGEAGGRAHRAWAWAANAGYRLQHITSKPGLQAGYAMASGERCTNAPEDGTGCGASRSTEFFNFFPTNHPHYGLADMMGWRNVRDLDVRGLLSPAPKLEVVAAYHNLQLHEPRGAWKTAGGGLVGAGWDPTNTARALGHEIDVAATYKPLERLMVQAGYAAFIPDAAGRRLAGDSPQHFLWLWLVFNFDATVLDSTAGQ